MSDAWGEVIYEAKVVGLLRYHGTSGAFGSNQYYLSDGTEKKFVTDLPWVENCSCTPVRAQLYNDYGDGTWWDAPVCLKHCIIFGNLATDSIDWFHLQETGHTERDFYGGRTGPDCEPNGCPMVIRTDGYPIPEKCCTLCQIHLIDDDSGTCRWCRWKERDRLARARQNGN